MLHEKNKYLFKEIFHDTKAHKVLLENIGNAVNFLKLENFV